MPPQPATQPSASKITIRRSCCPRQTAFRPRTRGAISRRSAATIPTLGFCSMSIVNVAMRLVPFDGTSQRRVDGNGAISQIAFRFAAAGKHLLPAHAHGVYGGARLATAEPSGDQLIAGSEAESDSMRNLPARCGDARNGRKLIQNLL